MDAIKTKDLFEEYFSQRPENEQKKVRSQVDRPEVYEYEHELNKSLIDMDVDELFELLSRFNNRNYKDKNKGMSYTSYKQISTIYRTLWNYYIDHHRVIKNPWNDKRMRGKEALDRIFESVDKFTKEDLEKIIDKLYLEYSENEDKAKYYECILLLFYDGFYKAEEIAILQEDMISFRAHEIRLPGRTIKLSDRCFSLLCQVHNMKIMKGFRGDYLMVSWNGGYFKFPTRPSHEEDFKDNDLNKMTIILNKKISDINRMLDVNVNYKLLYYMGLYNKICDKIGKERADYLIESRRNSEDTKELLNVVTELGYSFDNSTYLKESLRAYN